jgi:hypothetical protein
MSVWRSRHDLAPVSGRTITHLSNVSQQAGKQRVPMRQSAPIEVDGVFLGAAVEHELGVRFIAVDVRVTGMDQSIWPNVEYAYRSARQLFKSGRLAEPG